MWRLCISFLLFLVLGCQITVQKKTNCHFFINNEGNYPQKKTATCARRSIKQVPENNAAGIVSILDLNRNEIDNLHQVSFQTWKDLEELNIADNKVVTITTKAFVNLRKLRVLNLSGNTIRLTQSMSSMAFAPIPNLQILDLSYNPLFQIPNRFFAHLRNLQELRLGNNGQHSLLLHNNSFAGLNKLKALDLTNNQLTSIPEKNTSEIFKNMPLEQLELGNNPWNCDCRLRWLKVWIIQVYKNQKIEDDKKDPVPIATCAEPAMSKNKPLFSKLLTITDFQCPPIVRTKPARYIRPMHNNLTLSCLIHADPKGLVRWYKDGVLVQEHWKRAKTSQTQGREFKAELVIIDLQPNDAGAWVCSSKNRRGESQVNFTVEVVVPGHSSQTLTRIIIYCGIGAVGALLLCVGIGLIAYCLNCRRKDYRGYNKGTAGASGSGLAETRRLHTPTDAANPTTDESDYEPTADHGIPPPPPPPPQQGIGATHIGPSILDGTMTMPGRKSSQQALLAVSLSGPVATMDRKSGIMRLEKVPLTSAITQHDANSNNIASFPTATLPRPNVPLSTQQQPSQQRDHCPVHGTPTGANYRTDGHYSPCPVHGDAATVARNSVSAPSGSGQPTSGAGGHNNPLYGTMPNNSRYKPCPLHGDVYATLQTRQASSGGPPACAAGHHAGLQSPSQGSNASSTTMTLQTIMRSKDNPEGVHASYIRASRVDDCISGSPGGCGSVTGVAASGGGHDVSSGPGIVPGTLPKIKPIAPNVNVPKLEDEGYSTSV